VQRRQLLIFGAGGFGREVASWAGRAQWQGRGFEVVAFVDDAATESELNGRPLLTLAQAAERFPQACVLATVGNPKTRELLIAKAAEAGLEATPPVVHPNVEYDHEYVEIAEGVVICAGSILTVQIVVEAHAQINLDCTIGHDVVIGRHSTLSPGVHISGNVTLEPYTYIGTGAVTVNGLPGKPLLLGEGSVIGAGAVVTKHVAAGVTVTGVPARPMSTRPTES
jgi:sugar O-acyltransferase (sialic acid O-acetyltransferase NeuD family)